MYHYRPSEDHCFFVTESSHLIITGHFGRIRYKSSLLGLVKSPSPLWYPSQNPLLASLLHPQHTTADARHQQHPSETSCIRGWSNTFPDAICCQVQLLFLSTPLPPLSMHEKSAFKPSDHGARPRWLRYVKLLLRGRLEHPRLSKTFSCNCKFTGGTDKTTRWSLLHSAILRSRADSLRSHVILHEWLAFCSSFFEYPPKWCIYRAGMTGATRNRCCLDASSVYTMHHVTSCKTTNVRFSCQACLAVTCHLHFWQNDRDLLRATVVTREGGGGGGERIPK